MSSGDTRIRRRKSGKRGAKQRLGKSASVNHLTPRDMVRVNILENTRDFFEMKLRIPGFDSKQRTVRRRVR